MSMDGLAEEFTEFNTSSPFLASGFSIVSRLRLSCFACTLLMGYDASPMGDRE